MVVGDNQAFSLSYPIYKFYPHTHMESTHTLPRMVLKKKYDHQPPTLKGSFLKFFIIPYFSPSEVENKIL